MPTIMKKQFEDYEQLCRDRNNGRLLTSDGLWFICEVSMNCIIKIYSLGRAVAKMMICHSFTQLKK